MKDERPGVSKEEIMKHAKENSDLVEFVKSLSKEEIQRIKDVREFETIKPGTPTYKIAVLCDSLRQNLRRLMMTLDKRLWSIDDLQNNIRRLEVEKASGLIKTTLKNGEKMNESELASLIQHHKWLKDGEFYAIYTLLAEIRSVVGHKDIAKQVILTLEDFDNLVESTNQKLRGYGYELYGELK